MFNLRLLFWAGLFAWSSSVPPAAAGEPPATPLPSRESIFSAMHMSRPAISPLGQWIAMQDVDQPGQIRLMNLGDGADRVFSLASQSQIYWYRWSSEPDSTLLVAGRFDGKDNVMRLRAASGTVTPLIDGKLSTSSALASYRNNFAFIHRRFQDKVTRQYVDLTADGRLAPVSEAGNLVPQEQQAATGFLSLRWRNGITSWHFGDRKQGSELHVGPVDERQGTTLVAMTNDNRALMLSSVDRDTLALVSYDLRTGQSAILAQEKADINKVILDPADLQADAIEFEDEQPRIRVLRSRIQPDIDFLSAQGLGTPSIADRAPDDSVWLVRYAAKNGFPVWARYHRAGKSLRQLALRPALAGSAAWFPSSFTAASPAGTVSGYAVFPRADRCKRKGCPAVVLIHGGPAVRDEFAFDAQRYWLTSRGMAVITVNYRGSLGFGKKRESQDAGQWGSGITDDIERAVAAVRKKYRIDPDRVAVMGSSFGGFQALRLLAGSNRYRCAVVDSAFTDVAGYAAHRFAQFGEQSDLLYRVGDHRVAEEANKMRAYSPVSYVAQLARKPVLQFHGGGDQVVPMGVNETFSVEMQKANTKFTYVHLPNAEHGLPGLKDRRVFHALAESFLARCLQVNAEPATSLEKEAIGSAIIYGARDFLE